LIILAIVVRGGGLLSLDLKLGRESPLRPSAKAAKGLTRSHPGRERLPVVARAAGILD
jgi:hypothetical protein